jgi:hypothetical protein
MPLASSRHASQKRAEAVAAEKKERERRQRLSLPASIKSTTHVNEAKAKRRLSRRLSAHLTISSKENDAPNKKSNAASPESPRLGPTPYYKIVEERGGQKSPPLTRSHKKESRKDPTEFRGGGMVLNFSPPNQEENARRELARMDASERERYVCFRRHHFLPRLSLAPRLCSNRNTVATLELAVYVKLAKTDSFWSFHQATDQLT